MAAIETTYTVATFAVVGAAGIGAFGFVMHRRHRYNPNLIGTLIAALLCFLLLEALPALI
jgi:hypothetical protein